MRLLWMCPLVVCLCAGQTLTLDAALEMAARQNPGVQVARLRVLEREALAVAAKAAYLPQADLVVSTTYQTSNLQGIGLAFPGFDGRIGPYRTFNARPVVTQKLLDFTLLSSIRAARLQTAAARLDMEAAREEIQAAVITLYLQSFQAQSRVRAGRARLSVADALLAQVADREKGGASSQLDVARNRQQRESEQVALLAAEQELALLRPALAELLGGPVEGELAEPKLRLATESGQRFDVRAAEARVRVAEQEAERARKERWPKLTASGDYGVLGAGPDRSTSTYAVGATLQIPLWTSGRLEAEQRAARQRVAQGKEEMRRLSLQAERQAAQARVAYAIQQQLAEAAAASAEEARRVLALARLRYEAGMATAVDTVTAQGALAQAEDTEIRARYETSIALARLAFAQGAVKGALAP
ncbi:MAG TPA: TolC family protein [Bryobacteraceae bacterium]|nr:TolC family protein [Bryobacteraceae bacterium]